MVQRRKLTEEELDLMNEIDIKEDDLGHFWKEISSDPNFNLDGRWLAVAKTHFEEGFMALVRAVTKPVSGFDHNKT